MISGFVDDAMWTLLRKEAKNKNKNYDEARVQNGLKDDMGDSDGVLVFRQFAFSMHMYVAYLDYTDAPLHNPRPVYIPIFCQL